MAKSPSAPAADTHPAPMRDRVAIATLGFALFGAPAAWASHQILNYALAAYACFPDDVALTSPLPGWSGARIVLILIDLAALIVGAAATFAAKRSFDAVREEKPGSHHQLLERGEGRTRFLAACALMTGVGFSAAILFDTIATFMAPQCAA